MLKKVHVNLHHSQVADPPADIVDEAMRQFEFPSRTQAIMALKSWQVAATMNKWDGRHPDFIARYAMFMAGFVAGYNLHLQETREIAQGN